MGESQMSDAAVLAIVNGLAGSGVRCWLMGGWGIDALVGHQTRAHHDLDLLVVASVLPATHVWLRGAGFTRSYEWNENVPVVIEGTQWDTAFVERHDDGKELDVHALADGVLRLATDDPWDLPSDTLTGIGTICGQEVACVSVQGQRAMHVGYDLPRKHRIDLRRLENL